MASVQQYLIGFILLIVAGLTGFFLSWQGGMIMDRFANNGTPMGVSTLSNHDQMDLVNTTFYDTAKNGAGTMPFVMNLYYLGCYMIPLLGVAWYWQSLVKYQSYDSYGSVGNAGGVNMPQGQFRRRRRR